MAKGNTIVTMRLSDEMIADMRKAITSRNKNTQEEPWNVSDFIRHCIRVKLAHNERAKKVKGKNGKLYKPGMAVIE